MFIFFDFDGTLVDITERWWRMHLDVAREFSLPHYTERADYVDQKKNGIPEKTIMQKIAVDRDIIMAYDQERVRRIELPEYLLYDKLFFDTITTLSSLRAQNRALAIVTKRRSRAVLNQQLDRFNLSQYFQEILVTEGISKKDLLLQNHTAAELQQSLFISDGLEDMAIAGQLGMRAVAAGYGCRTSEFLASAGAINIISSLAEVLSYA